MSRSFETHVDTDVGPTDNRVPNNPSLPPAEEASSDNGGRESSGRVHSKGTASDEGKENFHPHRLSPPASMGTSAPADGGGGASVTLSKLADRKKRRDESERRRSGTDGRADTSSSEETGSSSPTSTASSNDNPPNMASTLPLSKMLAPPSGPGYTRCLVTRDRKGLKKLLPLYQLYLQDKSSNAKLIMVAQKQPGRTPNYRFFDMSRGFAGGKLSKKSGNYVGKLRANFNRDEYTIFSSHTDKTSLGAVVYDKCDMVAQLRDGAQPRKMGVLLPKDVIIHGVAGIANGASSSSTQPRRADKNNAATEEREFPISKSNGISGAGGPWTGRASSNGGPTPEERLAAMLGLLEGGGGEDKAGVRASKASERDGMDCDIPSKQFQQLTSKEPVFEKGNYRLNFHGRVKLPSVKNYQLVPPEDLDDVWTQFGKVNEHDFHLDFKAPLTPLHAFAIAISQFDY